MALETHTWAGRHVISSRDVHQLDREAAIHEFDGKLPRDQAEDKAYQEYRLKHHAKAAAYHLNGVKEAMGSGNTEDAEKHHAMYKLHVKALGHSEFDETPDDVKQYLNDPQSKRAYRFSAHRGDALVLHKTDGPIKPLPMPGGKRLSTNPTQISTKFGKNDLGPWVEYPEYKSHGVSIPSKTSLGEKDEYWVEHNEPNKHSLWHATHDELGHTIGVFRSHAAAIQAANHHFKTGKIPTNIPGTIPFAKGELGKDAKVIPFPKERATPPVPQAQPTRLVQLKDIRQSALNRQKEGLQVKPMRTFIPNPGNPKNKAIRRFND